MTTPSVDITAIVPKKWKTVIGLVGSLLTFVVPFILSAEQYLPPAWTTAIGIALAVLTAFGIYKAPYVPKDATLAPDTAEVAQAALNPETVPLPARTPTEPFQSGKYKNPWA